MGIPSVKQASALLLGVFIASTSAQYNSSQPQKSGYQYVDPLIGTINGGTVMVLWKNDDNRLTTHRPRIPWRDIAIRYVVTSQIQVNAY